MASKHPQPCKVNDRIELVSMPDDPNPIPAGTQGSVTEIEYFKYFESWQVAVKWDNGRTLMLSIPPDQIRVL